MVAHGTPCLGPVTHAGCGAICPAYHRGCYGCFGPMESPNTAALNRQLRVLGMGSDERARVYHTFNTAAPPFHDAGEDARDAGSRERAGSQDQEGTDARR